MEQVTIPKIRDPQRHRELPGGKSGRREQSGQSEKLQGARLLTESLIHIPFVGHRCGVAAVSWQPLLPNVRIHGHWMVGTTSFVSAYWGL